MTKDWLRYDRMVEDALRSVVKRALKEVAQAGLPGDHHFYLTFRTGDDGVQLANSLKTQYPKEMTIVLQHQFWGLDVRDQDFSVTLSFGGKHECLVIPYGSIVSFADPSVKFGLQFDAMASASGEELSTDRATGRSAGKEAGEASHAQDATRPVAASVKPMAGAQVVTLDAFRKK